MTVKTIKINPINRIYYIIKMKWYIWRADRDIKFNQEIINLYLDITDMVELAIAKQYCDDAININNNLLQRKAACETLLADLLANIVTCINL